jgi:hypothetical protein
MILQYWFIDDYFLCPQQFKEDRCFALEATDIKNYYTCTVTFVVAVKILINQKNQA